MMYSVMEEDASGNGNTVMVCVDLIGELDREVTVVLTTMSGSATGELSVSYLLGKELYCNGWLHSGKCILAHVKGSTLCMN